PFETMRTPERQTSMYEQGRLRPGAVVTNAQAWQSWHQYGVATDLVFDGDPRAGVQWDWVKGYGRPDLGQWQDLGRIMMEEGLEWLGAPGSRFPEMPHFQLTGGLPIHVAQELRRRGGVQGVWEVIGNRLGLTDLKIYRRV